jgi:CRP-like cAMP-binding protein
LIDARDITTGHQKGRLPLVPTGALHAPEENMTSNTLLARLSRADRQLLEAHLQAVDLRVRKQLQARNKRVEQVYFIDSGVASVVANGQRAIEVGMIGREGMTGLPVLLNNTDRIPHETYMQVAGSGRRLSAKQLREAIAASATLHQGLLGYVHAFMAQTTQTALANGRSKIEERLARWLLLVHDRVDGDEIALTHEFLSVMLGVRRPGVTTTLQELERKGLIAHRRSYITIVDREGLVEVCNGSYWPPNND